MNYKRRRIATLDLGTNSLLLLVAERNEEGRLSVLADESVMPRLGEGLRATGKIDPQVLDRTCEAVRAFAARAAALGADETILTATSAVREAANQEEVVLKLSEAAGKNIEILPPNEEARLTYLSVTTEQGHQDSSMVVDIGGGSTEITWGIGPRFDGGRSLNLGTVKLLNGPLKNLRPSPAELDLARKEIDRELARLTPLTALEHYYGTAGSFTHLAAVDAGLKDYTPDGIAMHVLGREKVRAWVARLAEMSPEERLQLPGLDPRRADVILPGTLIIERLFEKFKNESFTVIDRGIRFGKLFDRLRGFQPPVHFPPVTG